jgi:hypothetical protein
MSPLTSADMLLASDTAGRDLGRVRVESYSDGLFLGDFAPGPDYPEVEPTFRFFADVVEQQSFSYLDEAQAAIARLGVRVRPDGPGESVAVYDVQIYPDGGFSCRLQPRPAGKIITSPT